MIQNLSGLAMGIVLLAIIIGVGLVVLSKFGNSVGGTANTTIVALMGELDTTTGLGSWVGAIVALVIGLFFIGALMGKRKY